MKRDIDKLANSVFDVVIVGGGINGAAILNMASLNGLHAALIDKNDFASGTSSKSTKLVHGGLRYLENFEFDLVHEALRERSIQLKNAPHLVKPLSFVIPVYQSDQRPLWLMKLGVRLYDLLSGKYIIEKHSSLTREEVIQKIPDIKQEGLIGGVMYYDAQMDDARLCLENVLMACENGAEAANYVKATSFIRENGRSVGIKVVDQITGKPFDVRGKRIVCCVGPWTNFLMDLERIQGPRKVRTTKGIHVVYHGQASEHAILIPTMSDQRIFFIIPWMGHSLIGTTDTDYQGDPDNVTVEQEDVDYLIKEAQRLFPNIDLKEENIITTFAGLRPLVQREGAPSKLSRKHVIEESYSGVIYVMGGKFTTYRKIAEDCTKLLTKKKLIDTKEVYLLYGSGEIEDEPGKIAEEYQVSEETVNYLMGKYGTRFKDVLELTKKNESLKNLMIDKYPAIEAQIHYAAKNEMALKPEDVIWRRLGLGFVIENTKNIEKKTEKILSSYRL